MSNFKPSTSWQAINKWYDESVGEQGHYYHKTLIMPNLIKLLNLPDSDHLSLLDLACGQGVLSRHLPAHLFYTGIDLAPDLIRSAKQYNKRQNADYFICDVTKPLPIKKTDYDYATVVLALQNIEDPLKVFQNASKHLKPVGKLLIILNHPCFRIPRQSSWKVDLENKTQYRRIDRYMSSMKIPIQAHPSQGKKSAESWSFHYPLSSYIRWLNEAGFAMTLMEEWCSNKTSEGKMAKMENRSRSEIPLFMAIVAKKQES